jgi:hypothetical protein
MSIADLEHTLSLALRSTIPVQEGVREGERRKAASVRLRLRRETRCTHPGGISRSSICIDQKPRSSDSIE